jgi:hypothetical protein
VPMRVHRQPARSLGTEGVQPSREPERSRQMRPVQADGGRSDDRARVSAHVPNTPPPKQVAAPKAERSGALARCLAGSEMRAVGEPVRAPISARGCLSVDNGPLGESASLTHVQTLPISARRAACPS